MKSHKSQYVIDRVKLLNPVEVMARNERCWCLSGRKWKHCHAVRHLEQPLPISAHLHEIGRQMDKPICLHPDAPESCSPTIARAHTIQKRMGIAKIAENGHVLSGRDGRPSEKSNKVNGFLPEIGIKSASTFRGFCSLHDGSTFRPCDQARTVDSEVAFLLGYRALFYEYYAKMQGREAMLATRDTIDRGATFAEQAKRQQEWYIAIQGFEIGYEEHGAILNRYHEIYKGRSWEQYNFQKFKIEPGLPIVSSGCFFPEFSFSGKSLQSLENKVGCSSLLSFNLMYLNDEYFAIFGWVDDPTRANECFLESISSIDVKDIGEILIKFCFETSDNTFVRPSWWASRSQKVKEDLTNRLRTSLPGARTREGLLRGEIRYLD